MAASRSPPALGPYRQTAPRAPHAGAAWTQRRRSVASSAVARVLLAPVYVGVTVAAVVAITLAVFHGMARERDLSLTPACLRWEEVALACVLLTVPIVFVALRWTCARFAASRASKRRYVVRQSLVQMAAVVVSMAAIMTTRPQRSELLASATRAKDGREAYVHRWRWGCGYRVSVAVGQCTARTVTAVGPFSCDAQPPQITWHGDDVTLSTASGEVIGSWSAERR